MDRALRARLERRFGEQLTGPVRQRHDETEIRIAAADVIEVLRRSTTSRSSDFEFLADLCGVDTGDVMQVVYHLWSATTVRLAPGHRRRPRPRGPARPLGHVPLEGRRVEGARGVRHVRHHLRGQPRPPADLHAARLRRASRSARTSTWPTMSSRSPAAASGRWSRPDAPADAPGDAPRAGPERMRMTTDARSRRPAPTPPSTTRGHQSRRRPRSIFEPVPPYPPDGARGRVLHARRRRDAHEHGAAAPVDARRAPRRPQARRREGRGPRPGPRLPPPRRREALRERRLPPGDLLHGPARVRQLALLRVAAGHGLREAARRRGPAPRGVHPRPLGRAQPDREPRALRWAGSRSTSAASRRSSTASSSATRSWTCSPRSPARGCSSTTSASAASTAT